MRPRALLAALLALLVLAGPAAAQTCPQTSLGDIEDEVMCPRCERPLNTVDREPQAVREREYIQTLIAQCKSKGEIKDALVAQFGPEVLAVPKSEGFDVTAFVVPVLVPLVALGAIVLTALRWRRRRPAAAGPATPAGPAGTPLDSAESARLDKDLERYDL